MIRYDMKVSTECLASHRNGGHCGEHSKEDFTGVGARFARGARGDRGGALLLVCPD